MTERPTHRARERMCVRGRETDRQLEGEREKSIERTTKSVAKKRGREKRGERAR